MNAVARADQLNRWRLQKCGDSHIASIEHARFTLTHHGGHGGCALFLAALGHESEVME